VRPSESWARGAAIALSLCAVSWGHARAQDEGETALARSLFEQGVAQSDAGDWSAAADQFRRSLSLRWSPVVAFNLATALERTGALVEAEEHFRSAMRDDAAPARLREAAAQGIERVRPRLARLTLEIEGPREGVTLRLDGDDVPEAAIGVAAPADPGAHVLIALRDDAEIVREHVELEEGGAAVLRVAIPPRAELPPLARPEPPPAQSVPRPAPIGVPDSSSPDEPDDDTPIVVALCVAAGVLAVGVIATITAIAVEEAGHGDAIAGNLGPAVIVFD
jgi:hypothetical protein